MKRNLSAFALFWSLLFFSFSSFGQAEFYFTTTVDTATEGDGMVLLCYIKTNQPSSDAKSYRIEYAGGTADSSDIGHFAGLTVNIPANTDSVPFSLYISDDTKVEFTEYAQLLLRGVSETDSVGVDSVFTLYIKDNELPATIGFVVAADTSWENIPTYTVLVQCNNPNPTPVTCFIYNDEGANTMTGVSDFYFWWHTITFPPGISTRGADFQIIDNEEEEALEYATVKLSEFGANIVTDSVFVLYVKDDDAPQPLSLSFETYVNETVWEDTVPVIPVYITTNNPWDKTYLYQIYVDVNSTTSSDDYDIVIDGALSAPPGIWQDTAYIVIKDDDIMEDIEQAFVHIQYRGGNTTTSPDTVFTINIIDTDSARIGFLGAAFSHVENEGTVAIKLIGSSPIPYTYTVPVHYYTGDAIAGEDFLFNDTTVVFPAFSADTQAVYVALLDDEFYTGTRQINFRIGDIEPLAGRSTTGIIQYTLFILDNDSVISGVSDISGNAIQCYPNPFGSQLRVHSERLIEQLKITNISGQTVYSSNTLNNRTVEISTQNWSLGTYFVQLFSNEKWYITKVVKSE